MEITRQAAEARDTPVKPLAMGAHRERETQGIRHALQALGKAYAGVAGALNARLQEDDCGFEELSSIGNSFGWVTDRQRLVDTFLASEPAVIAYAYNNIGHPEQIRSLAEVAAEFASERKSLFSALGLLAYIERELGWSEAGGAPVGNA